MDPAEQQAGIDKLQRDMDVLQKALLSSSSPPQTTIAPEVKDQWSRQTQKAIDLTDAYGLGYTGAEREELRSMEGIAQHLEKYEQSMNRVLLRMQNLLIEAIEHLEALEKHWQRLT